MGHTGRPPIPHNFQHGGRIRDTELAGCNSGNGGKGQWLQKGDAEDSIVFLQRLWTLCLHMDGMAAGGARIPGMDLLLGRPVDKLQVNGWDVMSTLLRSQASLGKVLRAADDR